jgi:hypothetical protein
MDYRYLSYTSRQVGVVDDRRYSHGSHTHASRKALIGTECWHIIGLSPIINVDRQLLPFLCSCHAFSVLQNADLHLQ